MWLALFFILLSWIVAFVAFKTKGTLKGLIIMIVAFGFSVIALAFINATNPITYPLITISTNFGNTIIPKYNVTQMPNAQSQNYLFILGEANVLIEVALVFIIIGYLFWERREKRIKKYNN
jgi:hypothetical protein